jgi:DNA-binding response OmpR family regulator
LNKVVLIAEDEPSIVMSLSFILNQEGYVVGEVLDGNQVVEKIREMHPGVVILDLMLPNRNGFEILKEVKNDPALQHIPILMLTAKGQQHDRSAAKQLGVDALITKPFSNREVLRCVEKLMQQNLENAPGA